MKIVVSQVLENSDEGNREVYGELFLTPSAEQKGMLSVDQMVVVSSENSIRVMAGYDLSSSHLSIFVKENEEHIFSAVVKTDSGVPYFAFCLRDGTFTELSVEMSE